MQYSYNCGELTNNKINIMNCNEIKYNKITVDTINNKYNIII